MDILEPKKFEIHKDGSYTESHYEQVKAGDHFRMFHPDGQPFLYEDDDKETYQAASHPYFDDELGVWFIEIK
ncbi:hypothetical protein ACFVHQ_12060 [Actinomycetes bacterium NPDC127524]